MLDQRAASTSAFGRLDDRAAVSEMPDHGDRDLMAVDLGPGKVVSKARAAAGGSK